MPPNELTITEKIYKNHILKIESELAAEKLRSSKLLEALKAILSETNKVKEGYFCSITDDLFSIATSVLAAYES